MTKFDFERLYAKYPRRGEGKTKGMKKLQRIIKNQEDYALFEKALDNYIALIEDDGRDPEFIKLWSTFVNNYEDYLEVFSDTEDNTPCLVIVK